MASIRFEPGSRQSSRTLNPSTTESLFRRRRTNTSPWEGTGIEARKDSPSTHVPSRRRRRGGPSVRRPPRKVTVTTSRSSADVMPALLSVASGGKRTAVSEKRSSTGLASGGCATSRASSPTVCGAERGRGERMQRPCISTTVWAAAGPAALRASTSQASDLSTRGSRTRRAIRSRNAMACVISAGWPFSRGATGRQHPAAAPGAGVGLRPSRRSHDAPTACPSGRPHWSHRSISLQQVRP